VLSRWGASLTVGFLGLVSSLPILGYLAVIHRLAAQRPSVVFGAVLSVLLCGASSFRVAYALLPDSAFRARVAGVIAAWATYLGVGALYVVGEFAARDIIDGGWFMMLTVGFVFGGWYPTLCGLAAGWVVEGKILATSNNKLQRTRGVASERSAG